jgi:hypothetical protein
MISSNKMILVGLGKIGYKGFPETHYQSAIKNNLDVVAGIDSSPQARTRFVTETGIPAYESLDALPEECWSSFFTVATSSNASFSTIKKLLSKNGPLGILVEKPFCEDASQSEEILSLQKKTNTPIRVNYSLQYSSSMPLIKSQIAQDKLLSGAVIYSSGLRENGSHFIRMICGLFPSINPATDVICLDASRFRIRITGGVEIDFIPLESPRLHNSEIRLVFEETTISFSEGLKIEIRKVNTRSPIRNWPRELELLFEGSFSDGFESSYFNQEWWRSPRQDNILGELALDHLCNRIIEATSGNTINGKEGAENEF